MGFRGVYITLVSVTLLFLINCLLIYLLFTGLSDYYHLFNLKFLSIYYYIKESYIAFYIYGLRTKLLNPL